MLWTRPHNRWTIRTNKQMQNSLFLGNIETNWVLSFLIESQQYLLLSKISQNNPRFKVPGNLNLETGFPCKALGIWSRWYHSIFFLSSIYFFRLFRVQQWLFQPLPTTVQEVVFLRSSWKYYTELLGQGINRPMARSNWTNKWNWFLLTNLAQIMRWSKKCF